MNCQNFENSITDLARQVPLEAGLVEDTRAHLKTCGNCAAKLEEQRGLSSTLRGLSLEMKTIAVPQRLEANLMQQFRRRQQVPTIAARQRRWLPYAAAAAVLLAVMAVVGWQLSANRYSNLVVIRPPEAPVSVQADKGVVAINPPSVTPVVDTQAPVSQPIPQKRRARRTFATSVVSVKSLQPIPNLPLPEVTTDFVTLGEVSTASLREGAQVFRVEMPRYAMARFGLPINMERYDERVKADVWVSSDGVARAIRFVQ